jgi:hypothetical protein
MNFAEFRAEEIKFLRHAKYQKASFILIRDFFVSTLPVPQHGSPSG